jgi:serine protease Do
MTGKIVRMKTFALRIANGATLALLVLTGVSSPALAQIVAHGQASCGWVGVRVGRMTRPVADNLGMTVPYGAIFGRPKPGSPAAAAKIESGDVITAINGNALPSWRAFAPIISQQARGTTVYFTTYRDGQLIERAVVVRAGQCPFPARKQ